MKAGAAALLFVLTAAEGVAQVTSEGPQAAPTQMVRAAGMPLNDASLPSGTLTVRVVRGAFTSNIVDQPVEVEVTGGETRSVSTDGDGRAQFARLAVGARVRAATVVGGERLQSDEFEMPPASGVRILLVADPVDAAAAASPHGSLDPSQRVAPAVTADTPGLAAEPVGGAASRQTVMMIARVLASITVLFVAGIVYQHRWRRRH